MTSQEIKLANINNENSFCVFNNESTFKGINLSNLGLKMYSYKGNNMGNITETKTPFDKSSEFLIGFKSFLSSDQKHHNMQFIIGKQIPLEEAKPIIYC